MTFKDHFKKKYHLFFFVLCLIFPLVYGNDFIHTNSNLPILIADPSSLYCLITGCTMQGDIDMNGYSIWNVNWINITYHNITVNSTQVSNEYWVDESGDTMTGNLNVYANISAYDFLIYNMSINNPTYRTLYDWIRTTQSVGKISGGIFTVNDDGNLNVSNGTGLIRKVNSDVADIFLFDWNSSTINLVDNSSNYIYVDYNSGNPIITSSTSLPSDHNTKILLGLVYKDGNELHEVTAGQLINNYNVRDLWKDTIINGKFQRASGMKISETGTRNFALTSGVAFAGLTKTTTPAFDSSLPADNFTYYYRDGSGGWNKITEQSQIDNTHYDDGSGTLATLSNGLGWRTYYGVHWVYNDIDGDVFVVYGQGDYLLGEAQEVQPPNSLPDLLTEVGRLTGKIIIEKNADSFTSIQSAFNQVFVPSGVPLHNELAGIQGGTADEYYHLTEQENSGNWTGKNIIADNFYTFNSPAGYSIDLNSTRNRNNIFTDQLYVGADTETIDNSNFSMTGQDAFVLGDLGVEGDIYTDNNIDVKENISLSNTLQIKSINATWNIYIDDSGTLVFEEG